MSSMMLEVSTDGSAVSPETYIICATASAIMALATSDGLLCVPRHGGGRGGAWPRMAADGFLVTDVSDGMDGGWSSRGLCPVRRLALRAAPWAERVEVSIRAPEPGAQVKLSLEPRMKCKAKGKSRGSAWR